MRGGLRWLDVHSLKQYNKSFTELEADKRLAIVDQIAFPDKAAPN